MDVHLKGVWGNLDFIKKLRLPFEKQKHTVTVRKEMKAGKIFLYDDKIIELLENQPMFYFQTAADFMLLKDMLGKPTQHIATCVMALALNDYVKKMHFVEADLDPIYPDLDGIENKLNHKGRAYLEVVFFDEDESESLRNSQGIMINSKQLIEEMKTEKWYIIDTGLGLVFEKDLYMKLENPRVKTSISGNLLQEMIEDTRELIRPDTQRETKQSLAVLWGMGKMLKAYPRHRYRDLLIQRLLELQKQLVQKVDIN